jgi:multidrug efflux pump subunit AcrA (membrane-fusion protein)
MESAYRPGDARSQFQQPGQSQQQQQQQQQHQFRPSDSLGGERHRRTPSPHFLRRHTEGGYDGYSQPQQQQQQLHHQQQQQQQQLHHQQQQLQHQQQQQQQQQLHLYEGHSANYEHYRYGDSSAARLTDYPQREIFYDRTNSERVVEKPTALKPTDNHLDSNPGFYDPRFSKPAPYATNNFSNVAPVTSQPGATSAVTSTASQLYQNETINITANKNYWEWNNNGNGFAVTFNGGVQVPML